MAVDPLNRNDLLLEERRRYRRVAACFQHSWMSNAKWRKALAAIANASTNVHRCEFNCIDCDDVTQPSGHDRASFTFRRPDTT